MSTQVDVYYTEGRFLFMYDRSVSANTEVLCIIDQPFIKPGPASRSHSSIHPETPADWKTACRRGEYVF